MGVCYSVFVLVLACNIALLSKTKLSHRSLVSLEWNCSFFLFSCRVADVVIKKVCLFWHCCYTSVALFAPCPAYCFVWLKLAKRSPKYRSWWDFPDDIFVHDVRSVYLFFTSSFSLCCFSLFQQLSIGHQLSTNKQCWPELMHVNAQPNRCSGVVCCLLVGGNNRLHWLLRMSSFVRIILRKMTFL